MAAWQQASAVLVALVQTLLPVEGAEGMLDEADEQRLGMHMPCYTLLVGKTRCVCLMPHHSEKSKSGCVQDSCAVAQVLQAVSQFRSRLAQADRLQSVLCPAQISARLARELLRATPLTACWEPVRPGARRACSRRSNESCHPSCAGRLAGDPKESQLASRLEGGGTPQDGFAAVARLAWGLLLAQYGSATTRGDGLLPVMRSPKHLSFLQEVHSRACAAQRQLAFDTGQPICVSSCTEGASLRLLVDLDLGFQSQSLPDIPLCVQRGQPGEFTRP